MTEQNFSTPASLPLQFGINPVAQGHPEITGWQTIDTFTQELKASAIADDIAALNFRTWNPFNENDLDDVFNLLVLEPEHRNNGTLAGRSANDLANTLRSGGWIFEGYMGVSVKPDSPRKSAEGKVIKYESPRGTGNQQLFVPRVSVRVASEIANKLGMVRDLSPVLASEAEDLGFWDWFLSTGLPLIITEGAKKAAALVSAGYPAIALNGVWGWGTNEKDMFGEIERGDRGESLKILNPDLEPFLDDREIVLAFDREDSPVTIRKVEAAKTRFREEMEGIVDGVTQLKWSGHKGIDDFIAAKGVKALDKAYAKRLELVLAVNKNSYFTSSIEDGLEKVTNTSSEYIGNHLAAIACIDNPEGDGSALLLEFTTFKGDVHRWTMLRYSRNVYCHRF
jgi:putative DNA primase/helicase